MWSILAFLALLAIIVGLIIKTESLNKEYKRLVSQVRLSDIDNQQTQQTIYELADMLALTLAAQLQAARRLSRFDDKDLDMFEVCLQAIPYVCKEMSQRRPSLSVAFQRAVRQLALLLCPGVRVTAQPTGTQNAHPSLGARFNWLIWVGRVRTPG